MPKRPREEHEFDVVVLSETPRIYALPNFLSDGECDELREIGQNHCKPPPAWMKGGGNQRQTLSTSLDAVGECPLADRIEARISELIGVESHEDECPLVLTFNCPETPKYGADRSEEQQDHDEFGCNRHKGDLSIGLHLDCNNGCPDRFLTVIMYLDSVPPNGGGETVFPCAGCVGSSGALQQEVLRATQTLMEGELFHTSNCVVEDDPILNEAGGLLLQVANHTRRSTANASSWREACNVVRGMQPTERGSRAGLSVRPSKGLAVMFYHHLKMGHLDTSTWHGGAAVSHEQGKWTMQKFKELPVGKSILDCRARMPLRLQTPQDIEAESNHIQVASPIPSSATEGLPAKAAQAPLDTPESKIRNSTQEATVE